MGEGVDEIPTPPPLVLIGMLRLGDVDGEAWVAPPISVVESCAVEPVGREREDPTPPVPIEFVGKDVKLP
jgi:hypothetical protein